MRRLTNILLLTVIAGAMLTGYSSCDDVDYTTSSRNVLDFSSDTVSFDTVFTGVGTSTYTLKVYNRHDKALLISSIRLGKGQDSYFRLNVDGQKGFNFSDITLRENDSMYIFIGMNMPQQDSDEPVFVKDSLVFMTNGVMQDVKLLSHGWDALPLHGLSIESDTVFSGKKPIIIYDSLVVKENATLTCEQGTKMFFHGKSFLRVDGKIIMNGTLTEPVTLRGDRTDYLFSYLPYDRVPGQWSGVNIGCNSFDNVLNHVDIHGSDYGIICDSSDMTRQKMTLNNCRISNTTGNGIEMTDCKADFINCELSNAGGSCIDMTGGNCRFIHCTMANYYTWGIRFGVALSLRNITDEKIVHPITEAAIINCIIAGNGEDEISGQVSEDKTVAYNYRFYNSLITSIQPESGDVNACIWEKDDNFMLIDKDNYLYDFRLDSLSKAIGIGNMEYAQNYPTDRNGRSRLDDGAPDAGCYEWRPNDKAE